MREALTQCADQVKVYHLKVSHGSWVKGQGSIFSHSSAPEVWLKWLYRHSGQRRAHFRNRTYNTRTERQLVLQSKKRSEQPVGHRSFISLQERKNKKTANSSQSTLDQAERNFRPCESSLMQIVVLAVVPIVAVVLPTICIIKNTHTARSLNFRPIAGLRQTPPMRSKRGIPQLRGLRWLQVC